LTHQLMDYMIYVEDRKVFSKFFSEEDVK